MKCPTCGTEKKSKNACCREAIHQLRVHAKNQSKVIEKLEDERDTLAKKLGESENQILSLLEGSDDPSLRALDG
jgi:hypothetical protein